MLLYLQCTHVFIVIAVMQVVKQEGAPKGSIHSIKMERDNLQKIVNQKDVQIRSLRGKLDEEEKVCRTYIVTENYFKSMLENFFVSCLHELWNHII